MAMFFIQRWLQPTEENNLHAIFPKVLPADPPRHRGGTWKVSGLLRDTKELEVAIRKELPFSSGNGTTI
jgi:hypothetical protein